jgi:hypothetical protein
MAIAIAFERISFAASSIYYHEKLATRIPVEHHLEELSRYVEKFEIAIDKH